MSEKNIEAIYPLSPMQEGLLFQALYAPGSGEYFVQVALTLEGELDVPILKRAWDLVVERHTILRTAFLWERIKQPLQVVRRRVTVPWKEADWREQGPEEQQESLESTLRAERDDGFDLSVAPLMRLTLIRTGGSSHRLIWSFHHMILDGWSAAVVVGEVSHASQALRQGTGQGFAPPRPYQDYITYLQRHRSPDSEAEAFWTRALAGFTSPTSLGFGDAAGRPEETENYADEDLALSEEMTARLGAFARENRLTVSTIVRGAWALLLSHYGGSEDVLFGVTLSGRPTALPGVETMVGLFINTLPSRVRVPPDAPLASWLAGLQEQQADLLHYEHVPLTQVMAWSQVPRGTPLFESLLVFENYPLDGSVWKTDGGLQISGARSYERTHYALTLMVTPGRRLGVKLMYDRRRFERNAVLSILGHLENALGSLIATPGGRVRDVEYLPAAERRQVETWNATVRPYPGACVQDLIVAQSRGTPERIAAECGGARLSYGELEERTSRLAVHLRGLGAGRDVLVGIFMERSLDMLVSVLAVLRSGAAYVPLDPAYPPDRLAYMVEDSGARVLLTQTGLLGSLPGEGRTVVCVDGEWDGGGETVAEAGGASSQPGDLAYVIYTSGSTGRPKGVAVTHRSLVNLLVSMGEEPGLVESDVLLSVTTLSFDIAGLELYLPLLKGARLVLVEREEAADGRVLRDRIGTSGATVMQATPATWRLLLEAGWAGTPGLRVLCGGEALPRDLANALQTKASEVWNVYGPTETTIWSSAWRVSGETGPVPIGHPIANTGLYVLDPWLGAVPVGVPGELFIGGHGLARGYWQRPELTAEKFLPDPHGEPGARMYRTGDLARWRPDGTVECLGRLDHQVKVRGFRIELGEIEAALRQHPGVEDAAVLAQEVAGGDRRLVAYVSHGTQTPPNQTSLRNRLKEALPVYMVPASFVLIDRLPLTPNGKVDRKALPALDVEADAAGSDHDYVAPATEMEKTISEIWSQVLGKARVSVQDGFFDLGGHSLLLLQVIGRAGRAGLQITALDMFRYPTVRLLAAHLGQEAVVAPDYEGIRDRARRQRGALVRPARSFRKE